MTYLILAFFLFVLGADLLWGHFIPIWVIGLLMLVIGFLLVLEHFRVRGYRK